jgi:hypothetical protein
MTASFNPLNDEHGKRRFFNDDKYDDVRTAGAMIGRYGYSSCRARPLGIGDDVLTRFISRFLLLMSSSGQRVAETACCRR